MKCFICATWSLLIAVSAVSQVAVQINKMNMLYVCMDNPATIVAQGCDPGSLVVTTDNGMVRHAEYDEPGHFHIYPVRPGHAMIYVKVKRPDGRLHFVDSISCRVKLVGLPDVRISGKTGGTISAGLFKAQVGLRCWGSCDDANDFTVKSYTVAIYHDGEEVFQKRCYGDRFDPDTRKQITKLVAGDKISFTDITLAEHCYKEPRRYERSLDFTLK